MSLVMCTFLATGQQNGTRAVNIESQNFQDNPLEISNHIEVFPNPSIDFLMVNINNSTLHDTKIEIHSVIGNTLDLYIEEVGKDQYKINVKEFSSGYYFLVVKDDFTQFKKAYKFLKK